MRFSTISAVLCGLAIVPGVVSQGDGSGGSGGSSDPRTKIYRVDGEWVCDRQRGDFCFPICLENGNLKEGPGGITVCEEIRVANITDIPSSTSTLSLSILTASSTPTSSSATDIKASSLSVPQPPADSASGSKVSQIAGGVVGGVLGLALIGGLIFFLKRRKHNREKPSAHHESAVIADKSRASSPVSHTSPIYGGAGAAAVPPLAAPTRQPTDPEFANPPPSQQHVVPIAPVHTPPQQQAAYLPGSPAELQSREVDVDGVSVNSFDMQRPVDEPTVPRLPVNQPTGSGL